MDRAAIGPGAAAVLCSVPRWRCWRDVRPPSRIFTEDGGVDLELAREDHTGAGEKTGDENGSKSFEMAVDASSGAQRAHDRRPTRLAIERLARSSPTLSISRKNR